jgi:hypothetical protein
MAAPTAAKPNERTGRPTMGLSTTSAAIWRQHGIASPIAPSCDPGRLSLAALRRSGSLSMQRIIL